jgi:hypothetical protein
MGSLCLDGRCRCTLTAACRHANKTGMLMINKKSYPVQMGGVKSYADFSEGSLDLKHNCQVGTHTHGGVDIDRQVTQTVIQDCPDSIVQLNLGSIKVLSNSSASYAGGLAIVEGSEKEFTESFLLCGKAAMRTHIKNIVVFFHSMSRIQVASGKFSTAIGEAEVTRLESEVSFQQVKATMSLKEWIRQVKAEICDKRRQIANVRLESLVGAENPYSLMQVFGRGLQITRNGATVYVTKCQADEVVPLQHTEYTKEIPVTFDSSEVFVDPISLVIKTAAATVRCNDIALPRWKLRGKWYCSFPALRDWWSLPSSWWILSRYAMLTSWDSGCGRVYCKERI